MNKVCRTCKTPLTDNNTYHSKSKHYDYECKVCKKERNKKNRVARGESWLSYRKEYASGRKTQSRDWHLRNTYGLSLLDWEKLFVSQGSKCKICKTVEVPTMGWHTDHCHKTNKIRGILCHSCNIGLGKFKDDPNLLQNAITYLEDLI